MVKHQRRSHQRGIHGMDMLDDCTSESEMGDGPSTPMQWPMSLVPSQAGHSMNRANSFHDFQSQMAYNMQFAAHRHSVPADASAFAMTQAPFYVIDHENPGVATMNPNMQAFVPRTAERPAPIDLTSYQGTGLATPMNSSPSFTPPPGGSPIMSEGFYTTQGPQAATYALQNATQMEQTAIAQYPSPEADNGSWYNYQAPVDVSIVPGYGFELYGQGKIDFEDPSMQLPSSRLEAL